MTDREIMQQALEALEAYQHNGSVQLFDVAVIALRDRLARGEPDYKALYEQICERCDELDAKLTKYEERSA